MYSDYRLLDLVVHPVPQLSQCLGFIQQTPTRSSLDQTSSLQLKGSRQNTSRASELHLLETPAVVKVSVTYLAFIVKLRSYFFSSKKKQAIIYK